MDHNHINLDGPFAAMLIVVSWVFSALPYEWLWHLYGVISITEAADFMIFYITKVAQCMAAIGSVALVYLKWREHKEKQNGAK